MSFTYLGHAQILVQSTEQEIIEKAVKPGLFMVKQSFQICNKKTGELYGLNGKKEFGIQYSIGVKIPDGICLPEKAVHPWIYNNKYDKYKEEYTPRFYQSAFSELGEQIKFDTLDYVYAKQKILVDTLLYSISSKTFDGKGFVLDYTTGKKEGWLVWLTANKDANFEQNADIYYTIYRKTLNIDNKNNILVTDQPNIGEQCFLGGIYVVPTYTEVGIIEFRLCGILVPNENKWKVYCPFIGWDKNKQSTQPSDMSDIKDDSFSELTPVGNDNKRKNVGKKKKNKK